MSLIPIVALCLVSGGAQTPLLEPGSPAPAIEVRDWVKGKPIKALDAKKTYVVEFWATWCGPCIENIPHLTKIASENKDVEVIGVSVFEPNDKQQVQKFVKEMGDKMGYTVAYSGYDDKMAATWMLASKNTGIPTSFVVKGNKLLWIGHPMALDSVLAKVKSGTLDIEAERAKNRKRVEADEAEAAVYAAVQNCKDLYAKGNRAEAKEALSKLEADPRAKFEAEQLRFLWLAIEDLVAWKQLVTKLIGECKDEGSQLAMFTAYNGAAVPEACIWLNGELTKQFPENYYPWLCGARLYRALKQWDKGLEQAARSRQCILDFQAKNPNAPKGNALDVIADVEAQIKKERGG